MKIKSDNPGKDVLVFSDSKVFLVSIQDIPVKTLGDKNIGHISFKNDKSIIMKTFLDLFAISRASKVYVAHAPEIYNNSCFALLGARIGGKDFEVVDV